MHPRCWSAVGIGLACAAAARGQQVPAATTVQLPTFSVFTVSTAVAVPDSGGAFCRDPYARSYGFTAFGPAWGSGSVHWHTLEHVSVWSVGAQTFDLAAMDQAVLNGEQAAELAVDPVARHVAAARKSTAGHVPGSVADARAARAAEIESKQRELDELIAKAESLVDAGKPNLASVYFQMAAGQAEGERKLALLKRVAALRQMAKVAP